MATTSPCLMEAAIPQTHWSRGSDIDANFEVTTAGGTGSKSFCDIVHGCKMVTESGPPVGCDFISLACDDPDGGSTL